MNRIFTLLLIVSLFFTKGQLFGEPAKTGVNPDKSTITGEVLDVALSNLTKELENGIDEGTDRDQGMLKVAIMPVQSGDGMPVSRLGAYVRSTLSIRLIRGKKLIVLDRNTLDKLVGELEFQESELVAPDSRKRIGKFLGADVIMTSTIFDTGDYVKVTATLYDVSTARSLSAADCRITRSSIPPFLLRGTIYDRSLMSPQKLQEPAECAHEIDVPVKEPQLAEKQMMHPVKDELPVELNLTVIPVDARVEVNGEVLNIRRSGLYRIVRPQGKYVLSVYGEGFRKQSSVVNLTRGFGRGAQEQSASVDLTINLSSVMGFIALKLVDNRGAIYSGPCNISLNGELIEGNGRRSISCPPGVHNVDVAIESYYRLSGDVTVVDEKVSKLVFDIVKKPVEPQAGTVSVNSLAMKLMWVPSGTFSMGGHGGRDGQQVDEVPVHEVEISHGFWLGKHEVTQRQYSKIMGSIPCRETGRFRPVEGVAYEKAVQFCDKLSELEGKKYRLPTEAEWEYACRAGAPPFAFYGQLKDIAWYRHNSNGRSYNVGLKDSNAWGLCDMLGNVKEWCSDFYGPYFSASMVDPTGPAYGRYRILRGGSWFSSKQSCRPAYRGDRSDHPFSLVGFRIVCDQ